MQKEMTRYSKLNNGRKDTLVTFKDGDVVFFGIARCNLKVGDAFDRDLGRKIAKARALKAEGFVKAGQAGPAADDFDLDKVEGLVNHGCIKISHIKGLLKYFHSLSTTVRM